MLYQKYFQEGGQLNQIVCALLINLPVFSYGASIGWLSPMTLLLQSKDSPRDTPLTDLEVSWMASVPYLVCVPCDILMAMITDKWGRKSALIIISLSSAISWILLLCSFKTWVLILGRALVGISMAGCYVTCPIYIKEISDANIRGALGCLVILFQTAGNLFLYVIGDILSYNAILWICLAIPGIHILLFILMPDSPSYLLKKGKVEDATRALSWLRCIPAADPKIQQELDLIRAEQDKDESKNFLLKDIYHDKILFRAFVIAMVTTLARETCGAVPVLNFAGEIFTLASSGNKLRLSPNQQAMLLGGVQVLGSALASSLVEKSGRKPLLFTTSLLSGISMCTLASWFLLHDYNILAPSWIPLVTLCVCIFCDSAGLQPMSVVITGEIFSFRYRGTILAISMASASLVDFVTLLFFKSLANAVGIHVSFYFFGILCLLMALYVIFAIPETRARSLEDIYKDLVKKKDLKGIVNDDVYVERKDREVTRI